MIERSYGNHSMMGFKNLLVFAALLNVFYLASYILRNWLSDYLFGFQVLGLNYYDKDEYFRASVAAALASVFVLFAATLIDSTDLGLSVRECDATRLERARSIRGGLYALALASIIAFYLIIGGGSLSYEGIHQATQAAPVASKLLYLVNVYLGWEFGCLITQSEPGYGRYWRMIGLFVVISASIGMRAFLVVNAMILIFAMRLSPRKFILVLLAFAAMLIIAALARSGGEISADAVIIHIFMFLAGAASQVDLFYMSHYLSIAPSDLNAYFEAVMGEYFSGGGGLGSFYALELAQYLGYVPAMIAMLVTPIISGLCVRVSRGPVSQVLGLAVLAYYPIILRNPISSWLNGFIVFFVCAYVARKSVD
mgnify:CR=1 FL=1